MICLPDEPKWHPATFVISEVRVLEKLYSEVLMLCDGGGIPPPLASAPSFYKQPELAIEFCIYQA